MPFDAVQSVSIALRLIVLCVLFALAVIDVRSRRIPTNLVWLIGVLFFADALVRRMSVGDLMTHIATGGFAFIACAGLFALRLLGGGDAKLAAAIFLWVGIALSLPAFVLISIVGMLVSLLSLATRHIGPHHPVPAVRALAMFSCARGVPYGVALAAGGGAAILIPALMPLILTR